MNNQAAQTMPERLRTEAGRKVCRFTAIPTMNPPMVHKHPPELRALLEEAAAALSQTAGVPSWIVNDLGELGVMVNGVAYFLYKGDNIVYEDAKHDDGSPMLYRMVGKREFGEVCHPRHWEESGWAAAHRYTQELVYTPGLSFGKPEDGDWRPLPAKGAAQAASGGDGIYSPVSPEEEAAIDTAAGLAKVVLRLPIELLGEIDHRAQQDGCVRNAYLRELLAKHHSNPPAAASVSERAWPIPELHGLSDAADYLARNPADEYAQRRFRERMEQVRTAIEQALTQQRGECEAVAEIREHVGGAMHGIPYAFILKRHAVKAGDKLYTTPRPGAEALRDVPGNDPRVDDDSFTAAVRACRSQLGACRPYDDEPEEQWMWDKLTQLESLLARGRDD